MRNKRADGRRGLPSRGLQVGPPTLLSPLPLCHPGCVFLLQQDGLRTAGLQGPGDGLPGGGQPRHQARESEYTCRCLGGWRGLQCGLGWVGYCFRLAPSCMAKLPSTQAPGNSDLPGLLPSSSWPSIRPTASRNLGCQRREFKWSLVHGIAGVLQALTTEHLVHGYHRGEPQL